MPMRERSERLSLDDVEPTPIQPSAPIELLILRSISDPRTQSAYEGERVALNGWETNAKLYKAVLALARHSSSSSSITAGLALRG